MGDGADFAGPVGDDFDPGLVVMKNPEAADDDDVAGDDEDDEPWRQSPAFGAPWEDGEGGEGEEEEALVGEGVEEGSEFGKLVELAGEIAVEGVGNGGDDEDATAVQRRVSLGSPALTPRL